MKQRKVFFQSGALNLEGRLVSPRRAETGAGVVICHPHPLYGGSMDNNVVYAVSKALAEKGITSLCFNFRGVGRSEGLHDDGRGEIDDTLAAIAFLAGCSEIDSGRVGLAGYSFGGAVALNAACLLYTSLVAELDEPVEMNYVKENSLALFKDLKDKMAGVEAAWNIASARIFGPPAGEYGTKVRGLVETQNWTEEAQLADAYFDSMDYLYTRGVRARSCLLYTSRCV